MSHIQYTLPTYKESLNKSQLLYVTKSIAEQDWVNAMHTHTFSEIIYIVDGEGYLHMENQNIPLRKNNLAIVNPNEKHTEYSSKRHALSYIILGVANVKYDFLNYTRAACIAIDISCQHIIASIIQIIVHELKTKEPSYQIVCDYQLNILLIQLARMFGNHLVETNEQERIPYECIQIKNYMDTYFIRPITLDHLSKLCHQNRYYLSHQFKKYYGISPINYLLQRRITRCKELLVDFDFSISQISEMIGFSSSNYLTQVFKKHTGVSPLEYRKEHTTSLNK